ncbi:MAG: MXAN_5187 C-terminal domain-containing protein [Myxococcota bacterium]|nr:MXAN_5187 C-terminal domain-containing protein [Myxococcota bacterium]
MAAETLDDELRIMEGKLKQLKLDYEQYFCGSRPREPQQLRREVQKQVTECAQAPIQNTALRFRFNSINSRFQCFKRQWDLTLREIESGTYTRHLFKADLHERERLLGREATGTPVRPPGESGAALFDSYCNAAIACGQDVSSLTPEKLQRIIDKQQGSLREKLKCDAVDFRVIVKDGKVKLRASARR